MTQLIILPIDGVGGLPIVGLFHYQGFFRDSFGILLRWWDTFEGSVKDFELIFDFPADRWRQWSANRRPIPLLGILWGFFEDSLSSRDTFEDSLKDFELILTIVPIDGVGGVDGGRQAYCAVWGILFEDSF